MLKLAYRTLKEACCFEEPKDLPRIIGQASSTMTYRFDGLHIEESPEVQGQEPAITVADTTQIKPKVKLLEPETNEENELEFRYFCFL